MRISSGFLKGRVIKTIQAPGYRPATGKVREALFSILTAREVSWDSVQVLDLFAGSGSLGFEAISRGAVHSCFVENNPAAVRCLQHNIEILDIEDSTTVLDISVELFLKRPHSSLYDIIFIDPPYGEQRLIPTIDAIMKKKWLSSQGIISAEVESTLQGNFVQIHPDLILIFNKTYGQTRVLLWKQAQNI